MRLSRPHWSFWQIYPLVIAGLLAAGSIWLDRLTREPETPPASPERRSADFVASEVSITGFGADGGLRYILDTPRIIHLPQTSQTLASQPRLRLFSADGQTWLRAERGIVSAEGEQADFDGDVEVERTGKDGAALHFASERLTVWPSEQRAATDVAVRLRQGEATATAQGLAASNLFGILELTGKVKMSIPRHRRTS
jgi:lipopolysaccharide export system protein LptC